MNSFAPGTFIIHISFGLGTLCGADHHALGEARVARGNAHKATCPACRDVISSLIGTEQDKRDAAKRGEFTPGTFVIRQHRLATIIKRSKDKSTWMVRLQTGAVAWWPASEMELATVRCPRCNNFVAQSHVTRQVCRNKEV